MPKNAHKKISVIFYNLLLYFQIKLPIVKPAPKPDTEIIVCLLLLLFSSRILFY